MRFTDVSSFTSALLSSACCPIQLALSALGFSCAGFAVLTPYKPLFLTFTLCTLTIKWRSRKSASVNQNISFCIYAIAIILLSTMDQWIVFRNIPVLTARAKLYGNIIGSSANSNALKQLILRMQDWKVLEPSIIVGKKDQLTIVSFETELTYSNVREIEFEREFNQINSVQLKLFKSDLTELSATASNNIHVEMSNIKCAACFKRAQTIVNSKYMNGWISNMISAQYESSDKIARFHLDTPRCIQSEEEIQSFSHQLQHVIQQFGQHYQVSKIVVGFCNNSELK